MSTKGEKRKRRKKEGLTEDEELELQKLEKILFGKGRSVLENTELTIPDLRKDHSSEEILGHEEKKPAWEDTDDMELSVQEALTVQGRPKMGVPGKASDSYQAVLKRRFEARIGNPEWAKLGKKVESDEEQLLKTCGNFIQRDSAKLSKGVLDIKRLAPLNKATGREGPYINSVQFHKTSSVALVAGSAGLASIFQVDGSTNPHLQTVRFAGFPVRCARFSQDGNQFIVGSQHYSHYFVYDMIEGRVIRVPTHHATEQTNMKRFEVSPDGKLIAVCGKFGNIHLLHGRTREWIASLKMSGEVKALCFNSSGSQLWTHGDEGEVYVWDTASRKCVHKFSDEGCISGTSLALSPSGQLVACGSGSGVVNVYNTQSAMKSAAPQPIKALLQLVTAATSLQFNPSSQLLAMASDEKNNAFRLVHLPSVTVFSNFPSKDSLVGKAHSHDFSPSSGYLAIGTNQHTVHLFRLKHFGNY